jgi:2-polyprenyl-3-methyl-5-hydroxy-6-metoxy-1,4-benzoquinol methylase
MAQQWFHTWFNSPYYHQLYHHRNHQEAEHFIKSLCSCLKPAPGAKMLDIGCGRGRHAVYLNKCGFTVTGIDLSIASIQHAMQYENESLRFYVHDMRHLNYNNNFDVALNLFTSFGYFETDEEHVDALKTFNKALKPGGILVLDFFNAVKVRHKLVPDCVTTVQNVDFHIHKEVRGEKIIKSISFEEDNKTYNFREYVSAYGLNDFKRLFAQSGFEIADLYGDYDLDKFDADSSDRLIFICKKTNA